MGEYFTINCKFDKVTNRGRGSFPSGQRSRCPICSNVYCLDALTFLVVYENFAVFCSQLAL